MLGVRPEQNPDLIALVEVLARRRSRPGPGDHTPDVSEVVTVIACSRCKASPGEPCTPNRRGWVAHAPRMDRALAISRRLWVYPEARCECPLCWSTYSEAEQARILIWKYDSGSVQKDLMVASGLL